MKVTSLILTTLLSLTSLAHAEDDENTTEAKAAVDCHCTDAQQNNDLVTQDSREKRRAEAAGLTDEGGKRGNDPQGTGADH